LRICAVLARIPVLLYHPFSHWEARMAIFIVLKRPGPPTREVLVNLDEILMVQPGQGTGSAILFGREHLISFEEDFATVIRRIQTGPYVQTNPNSASPK
jgi:hypothetical protein